MKRKKWTRRSLLKRGIVAVAGIAGAGPLIFTVSKSYADDLPKVSEDDATAKALQYTHDASTSSARTDTTQFCNNCIYFKGDEGDASARCDFFPGKVVESLGWCNAWTAKT